MGGRPGRHQRLRWPRRKDERVLRARSLCQQWVSYLLKSENISELTVSRSRMYFTGDLGCWNSDGSIAILGRCDDQVKVKVCSKTQ